MSYLLVLLNCLSLPTYTCIGMVTIIPAEGSTTYVNGGQISAPLKLTTGSRIILGNNHVFRFVNPVEGT